MKIPTEFTAVDKFTSVVSKMTSGVSSFTKSTLAAVERVNTKISRGFDKLGQLGQLALGVGIGGLFAMAIQNNIDYNDSLASVSAITGATGKDLADLEKQAMKTANAQSMLGADVFKAYELIASAKPELLENTKLLDDVTNATATLSKAARMDMAEAADSLTTSLNQFGLGGEHAIKVVDTLAAGTVYGASSIKQTTDALSKFGTIAASTGTKVDESIALIQLVSPFEKGAEAGTKLRNVLGKMAGTDILPKEALKTLSKFGVNTKIVSDSTLPLSVRLKEMSKIGKDSTAVMQVFGTENAALAQAIFNNVGAFDGMLEKVNKNGQAQQMAATNTNTFKFAIESIKNSFLNATTATNTNNGALNLLKDSLFFVSKNMDSVIAVIGTLLIAYGALKVAQIASATWTFVSSVAMGVYGAATGKASIAIGKNTVALGAYKTMQAIMTAGTWLATTASTAFAVAINLGLWPILAVIAAIAAIIAIFYYWDEIVAWFSKQWETFTNWIGGLWDSLVSWFEEFDFVDFFKQIGQSIIDFMLFPLKSVLGMLSDLPLIGDTAKQALAGINELTDLGVKADLVQSPEATNSQNMQNSTLNGNIGINVNTPKGTDASIDSNFSNGIVPNVTSTQGAF